MVRRISPLAVFERRLIKFLKSHKELLLDVDRVMKLLEKDVHSPSLKTHKLH